MTKTRNRQTVLPKLASAETIIARIKYYMSINKIPSSTELGKRIGLAQANMCKKMRIANFSLEEAFNIAACLNVEMETLFFEDSHDEMLNAR